MKTLVNVYGIYKECTIERTNANGTYYVSIPMYDVKGIQCGAVHHTVTAEDIRFIK